MAKKTRKTTSVDETPESQQEFGGMPETQKLSKSDPIYKEAKKYLGICDEIAEFEEEMTKKKKELKASVIQMMKDAGYDSIIIDGKTFSKVHKEAVDELRVYNKKKSQEIENED